MWRSIYGSYIWIIHKIQFKAPEQQQQHQKTPKWKRMNERTKSLAKNKDQPEMNLLLGNGDNFI